ncbi:MAG: protein DpdJ [Bacillota bacterium]
MTNFELVSEILSFVERREERLLAWGFYDVQWTAQEIEQALAEAPASLREAIQQSGLSTAEHLQRMDVAALLHQVSPEGPSYRTRFAEGVRLLARLRQRFRADDWAVAPKLVADLKVHLAPRRYPKRDISPEQVWDALSPVCTAPELQQAAFESLSQSLQFSAFQKDALPYILSRYGAEGISGSVVSAGTGAGKTKAFYIPALLGCVAELGRPPFTKVIAIYPRTVLLADQLREALSEAAKLRPVLRRLGLRPLRMGALLAETAKANWFSSMDPAGRTRAENCGWRRVNGGYVVPFVKSPLDRNAELIWFDRDRNAGRTCLYRAGAGEPDIPDGELALTREQLMATPPDVLFLSAEMLNREMGNPQWSRTFGISEPVAKPRLLLLDEVHAYEGLPGAQVAWVLRRWRYWARLRNLHVVGLSATLKQASRHLAAVVGIPASAVVEFRPRSEDMVNEGMEYNLAIKGDPSSGTALLSTAIQTGMLMTRLLTPRSATPTPSNYAVKPEEFYARKVFGFSDNVDSVNRWFADMNHAELQRLARLRTPPTPGSLPPMRLERIRNEGQSWDLPVQVGHRLQQPLVISRCTAMDVSGGMAADLVIATSKLEVGFDDPEVGAVLHYKRPSSMSSFIQRKGRAGRRRGTRPVTAIILSDYGQDRWAFQHADRLFLPEIDEIRLPICNPYILRTQAVYFLVDWLGRKTGAPVGPFDFLARPTSRAATSQREAALILEDLIAQGPNWTEFRRAFMRLFSRPMSPGDAALSEADIDAILWDSPRPLLRHAIPALLRRLQAGWRLANPACAEVTEDSGVFRPLPSYLPAATFADLEAADVQVQWINPPFRKRDETLSVSHGLAEGCPGHVSKRFSLGVTEPGYWNPLSARLGGGNVTASVREVFPDSVLVDAVAGVQIYQPQSVPLTPIPRAIRDSSNGVWNWQSVLTTFGRPLAMPVLSVPRWRHLANACEAYLHRDGARINVLRYATTAEYDVRTDRGQLSRGILRLESASGSDASQRTSEAIGFSRNVDGLCIRLDPEHLRDLPTLPPHAAARFRADYFLHRLSTDPAIRAHVNVFMAELLWQTSMAMLAATALRQRVSLREAQSLLTNRVAAARHVADHIFGAQGTDDHGGDVDGRRKTELVDLWHDAGLVREIERLERVLWEATTDEFDGWVRRRYVATLAQALRVAAVARLPEISEDDLAVDVVWDGQAASIFLTELASGGLGQIETVVRQMRADPEAFHDAFEDSLQFCPRTAMAEHLQSVVTTVHHARRRRETEDSLLVAFDTVRSARGYSELYAARDALREALGQHGLCTDRASVAATVTTVLAPGSGNDTDRLLYLLNRDWLRASSRAGVGIDARVFAYIAARGQIWGNALRSVFAQIGGNAPEPAQLYALVQRMLLEDCHDSCRDCLDQPNRYNMFGTPSRELAMLWLRLDVDEIDADGCEDWLERAITQLGTTGIARVSSADRETVALQIPTLLAREVEVEYLLLPVSVARVDNRKGRWSTTFRLRGAIT